MRRNWSWRKSQRLRADESNLLKIRGPCLALRPPQPLQKTPTITRTPQTALSLINPGIKAAAWAVVHQRSGRQSLPLSDVVLLTVLQQQLHVSSRLTEPHTTTWAWKDFKSMNVIILQWISDYSYSCFLFSLWLLNSREAASWSLWKKKNILEIRPPTCILPRALNICCK